MVCDPAAGVDEVEITQGHEDIKSCLASSSLISSPVHAATESREDRLHPMPRRTSLFIDINTRAAGAPPARIPTLPAPVRGAYSP